MSGNAATSVRLSLIFPIRLTPHTPYILERIAHVLDGPLAHADIECVIVDSGSQPEYSAELRAALPDGVTYLYHDTLGEPFSIGSARDFGAMHAHGDFIMFHDIDLVGAPSFYRRLVNEKTLPHEGRYTTEIHTIPVFYLKEDTNEPFLAMDAEQRAPVYLQKYYAQDDLFYLNVAPSSSCILVHRLHYLSTGGHRADFIGHGFEDFELMNRLAWYANTYHKPWNFYYDPLTWRHYEYTGLRSYYAMFGYPQLHAGLVLFHLWHPSPGKAYQGKNHSNRALLIKTLKQFDQEAKEPFPLPNRQHPRKVLMMDKHDSITFASIRQALPLLGDMICRNPSTFDTPEDLLNYIEEASIELTLFHNPYGNEHRLSLYRAVREQKKPYLVYERGALPDSWFFDENGFNADSDTYHERHWNHPLEAAQQAATLDYIEQTIHSDDTLEQNGARLGSDALRQKYGLVGKKILFVPLQRPNDTVIRYFAESIGGMEGFVRLCNEVARRLPRDWCMVIKKHPLEDAIPEIEHAVVLDNHTHVHDCLAAASAVLLVNSGVGVLAMMFGKPCFHAGEAFYSHPALNRKVQRGDEVLAGLKALPLPARETMLRFLHYLRFTVYSFGTSSVRQLRDTEGRRFTRTYRVLFRELRWRIGGVVECYALHRRAAPIPFDSPHYLPFARSIQMHKVRPAGAGRSVPKTPSPVLPATAFPKPMLTTQPILWALRQLLPEKTYARSRKLILLPHEYCRDSKHRVIRACAAAFTPHR